MLCDTPWLMSGQNILCLINPKTRLERKEISSILFLVLPTCSPMCICLLDKIPIFSHYVILALYHKATANAKAWVASKEKMLARLSSERCNINTLWFKVMRTPISPVEIEPAKMLCFLYCILVRCNKSRQAHCLEFPTLKELKICDGSQYLSI